MAHLTLPGLGSALGKLPEGAVLGLEIGAEGIPDRGRAPARSQVPRRALTQ